ncbi:MAG: tetratricopeptide repeat protein [Crocinitomicaceae bacterium]
MKTSIIFLFFYGTFLFGQDFSPYSKQIGQFQEYIEHNASEKANRLVQEIAKKLPEDSLHLRAKFHFLVGKEFSSIGEFQLSEYHYLKSIEIQRQGHLDLFLVDTYLELGVYYYHNQKIKEALTQYKNALEISIQHEDHFGIALSYNNIGLIFLYSESYLEAEKYFLKALEYLDEETDYLKSAIYTNLGIIQYFLKDYKKSLDYLSSGEEIIRGSQDEDHYALANIQLNKALNYYELKEYSKAIPLLEESKLIYEEVKNGERLLMAHLNLMLNYYFTQNPLWKDLEEKLEEKVLQSDNSDLKYDFYNYLATIYKDQKNFAVAFQYLEKANEWIEKRAKEKTNEALQALQNDVNYKKMNLEIQELSGEHEELISENIENKERNEELYNLNRWILVLSGVSILFLFGIIFVLYRSFKVKSKLNNQLELQNKLIQDKHNELINSSDYAIHMEKMLLQQMNPHFIFNALMTIDASLNMREYEFAKKYIEQFTQLIRKTLDNSRSEIIPLEDEIEYLKAYIALYQTKLGDFFESRFTYNQEIVEDFVYTPPMLVQPFVENAILHGLMHKKEDPKILEIEIEPLENTILWKIRDNGIGRKASSEKNAKKNISHGSQITEDRISWMQNIYGSSFSIEYTDLEEGTLVTLTTPIVEK